ncbi:MAG: phenylalanine--tRNA ligase subunit beta [Woeseiaceae bacterium]
MKFSEQWLREWINPNISTDELSHQLTMAGLEVDAIEPVAAEFTKVVVGEVLSVEKHPDADKLNVCQVNVGEDEPLNIVCGAANVRTGLRIPTALVGAVLPGNFKIKKSKLRGEPSHGMLCSTSELGITETADGLMELPNDAPVGTDIRDYLNLNDVMIELSLTPNRADCFSIAGIAREVGVSNKMPVNEFKQATIEAKIKDTVDVKLEAGKDCPRYLGRVIKGVNPKAKTPLWLQEKLRRSGIRSLGPVVDVTNFVLLELGQPMHAFDLAKISGSIHARHAKAGETLNLLNDQEITLTEGCLVIADDKNPLALAGIMGGADSAVSGSTTDILLEAAHFNPLVIAGKARSFGLHTDSSHRFERGVAASLPITAIERATELLLDIVGGQAGPVVNVTNKAGLPERGVVSLRAARVKRVLGIDLSREEITGMLTRLDLNPKETEAGWEIIAPDFRFDISIEEDLIEEIGRIFGYDNLPASQASSALTMVAKPEAKLRMNRLRQILVQQGYQEAITYSFIDPEMQKLFDPKTKAIELANPISADLASMRTSLWPGLVSAVMYNLNRQQNRVSLFEYGLKFVPLDDQGTEIQQEKMLAGVITGSKTPEQWGELTESVDFYDLKNHVEAVLEMTGRGADFQFETNTHDVLHPGQTAAIRDLAAKDQPIIGWIGALHPRLQKKLGLSQNLYLFEIAMKYIEEGEIPHFHPLSKFPTIRRDIALVMDEAITAQAVHDCIKQSAGESLSKFELFDVYRGEGIDFGRKSLALGLTLQDLSRTLTDTEVDKELNKIIGVLKESLGATLRE